MKLAELLRREMAAHHKWGTRELAAATKVSRGAIEAILNGSTKAPHFKTITRFAQYFELPIPRVMEMAGVHAGHFPTDASLAERASALAHAMPQFGEVLRQAMELTPTELAGVLAYLEAVRRQRDEGGADDPDE